MDEFWIYTIFFVAWIVIQRWVLPRAGVST